MPTRRAADEPPAHAPMTGRSREERPDADAERGTAGAGQGRARRATRRAAADRQARSAQQARRSLILGDLRRDRRHRRAPGTGWSTSDLRDHRRRLHRRPRRHDRAAGHRLGDRARRQRQPVRAQGRPADPASTRATTRPRATRPRGQLAIAAGAARRRRSSALEIAQAELPGPARRRRRRSSQVAQANQFKAQTDYQRQHSIAARRHHAADVDQSTAALQQAAGARSRRPRRQLQQAAAGAAEHRPGRRAGEAAPGPDRSRPRRSSTRPSSTSATP